jgi:diguanylate cyclase (GGDEF)-like protein
VWPAAPGRDYAISIDGRPILLVGLPVLDSTGVIRSTVVLGVNAEHLALQAAATAWVLLIISYTLLALVGWSSFHHIDSSLGARIQAITAQIRNGSIDEPIETLRLDGVELRELARSVSTYITATLAAQKSSDDRHRRIIDLAPDGVIMCSKSSIRFVNGAALELTGARSRHDMLGAPIERFLELERMRADRPKSAARPARWKRLDGTILQVEVVEITESEDGGAQYLVRDVTDARKREAVLAHRAEHDSLTGLVNRARFETRLIELLTPGSASSRLGAERQVAVLYIDLDAFKPVNDRYGHAAGDAVLVAVADRLRDATRNSDLLARLGGDEFAVLLEVRDHVEVRNVADRILASLERPIELEGHSLLVGASIGIADTRIGADEDLPVTAAELLRAADAAMYTAKQSGGNRAAA